MREPVTKVLGGFQQALPGTLRWEAHGYADHPILEEKVSLIGELETSGQIDGLVPGQSFDMYFSGSLHTAWAQLDLPRIIWIVEAN